MKTAAVICEFNPLHNGHAALLRAARESGADRVVCIMSGSVVQRGELALFDKYERAVHAVRAGADAVFELPAEYVLSGAPQFAFGAVNAACALGGETELFFGSECGDVGTLENAVALLGSDKTNAETARVVATGMNYPSALAKAAAACAASSDETAAAEALSSPNNVLGIEYIKAIIDTGRKISYNTVRRPPFDAASAPTSSSIREVLLSGGEASGVPEFTVQSAKRLSASFGHRSERLLSLIKYLVPHARKGVHDDSEGLSDRLAKAAENASDLNEYLALAKVKRYPMARIKRLTLNILLDNRYSHNELKNRPVRFLNLLAADRRTADGTLGSVRAEVCATRRDLEPFADDFSVTRRADELFSAVCYPFARNARFV